MRTLPLAVFVCLAAATPSPCAYVALYVFGSDPVPVSSSLAGLTASSLTRNGVTDGGTSSVSYLGGQWPIDVFGASYYEATLTPNPGVSIDYSTITLDYVIGTNPTFTSELLSSVDSFTTPLSTHISSPGRTDYSDPLASLGLQGGPVTFRIYGYVDSDLGASGLFGGSLSFGTTGNPIVTVTPEPATLGWAAGALALLAIARKRSAAGATSFPRR